MKKFISLILIAIVCIGALSGCANNKIEEMTPEQIKEEQDKMIEEGCLYYGMSVDGNETVRVVIPASIGEYCYPKYSSNFDEGWFSLTISAKDESHDVFSVFASTGDKYKEYESKKNYKVLLKNDAYTVIWYEYDVEEINGDESIKTAITEIKNHFSDIQKSVCVRAVTNDDAGTDTIKSENS